MRGSGDPTCGSSFEVYSVGGVPINAETQNVMNFLHKNSRRMALLVFVTVCPGPISGEGDRFAHF